jgi:hypothetical protein
VFCLPQELVVDNNKNTYQFRKIMKDGKNRNIMLEYLDEYT